MVTIAVFDLPADTPSLEIGIAAGGHYNRERNPCQALEAD
jgi:hypothetical protein